MALRRSASNYRQVLLVERLRDAINRLNPLVPLAAREDALQQVLNLDTPVLLSANRHFHRLLVNGVPVQYQKDGETRGDFVRLIDLANVAANEWLAVNQFSIKGPKHTRRPDIILFVNGLPLVLLELKNPADENADIWKAYDQIADLQRADSRCVPVQRSAGDLGRHRGAAWVRCLPTPSASWPGAPSTA